MEYLLIHSGFIAQPRVWHRELQKPEDEKHLVVCSHLLLVFRMNEEERLQV